MIDEEFLGHVADRLAALSGVHAVTLGGSRAAGTAEAGSDWDLAVYYRGRFAPDDLRAVGWDGDVSDLGAWGGGVFNGGAWLHIDGRRVDVHYRDLDVVEHELAEARAGRFHREPLLFHLAGIPSYLLVAELALNRQLRGVLPRPRFPDALRESAPPVWRGDATLTLAYAEKGYAARGLVTETAGAIATAGMQAAHAVLAARGEWVTNEKRLLRRAGIRDLDDVVAGLAPDPGVLAASVATARRLIDTVIDTARCPLPRGGEVAGPSPPVRPAHARRALPEHRHERPAIVE